MARLNVVNFKSFLSDQCMLIDRRLALRLANSEVLTGSRLIKGGTLIASNTLPIFALIKLGS